MSSPPPSVASFRRSGTIGAWLAWGGLTWLVYLKAGAGPAMFVNSALVAMLLGFQAWGVSRAHARKWDEPGAWVLISVGFLLAVAFALAFHSGSFSFSPASVVTASDALLAALIAGWAAHAAFPSIVANFRISWRTGAPFGTVGGRPGPPGEGPAAP